MWVRGGGHGPKGEAACPTTHRLCLRVGGGESCGEGKRLEIVREKEESFHSFKFRKPESCPLLRLGGADTEREEYAHGKYCSIGKTILPAVPIRLHSRPKEKERRSYAKKRKRSKQGVFEGGSFDI